MKKPPTAPGTFIAKLKRWENIYGGREAVRTAMGGVPETLYAKWRVGKALPSEGLRLSICQLLDCKKPAATTSRVDLKMVA